jgi:hypothetical protein
MGKAIDVRSVVSPRPAIPRGATLDGREEALQRLAQHDRRLDVGERGDIGPDLGIAG